MVYGPCCAYAAWRIVTFYTPKNLFKLLKNIIKMPDAVLDRKHGLA
jgi:hypothetical protein